MSSKGGIRLFDRSLVIVEVLIGVAVVAAIVGSTYGAAPTVIFLTCALAAAFTGFVLVKMATVLGDQSLEITGRLDDEPIHEPRLRWAHRTSVFSSVRTPEG